MYACQRWGLKFSDESYIGYKNKSNRSIGSYKRSKSAAVLPSDTKNTPGEDNAGLVFPDKKELQPSWNSEWALQSNTDPSSTNPSKDDLTRLAHQATHNPPLQSSRTDQHHVSTNVQSDSSLQDTPPVRPARPSALSRQGIPNSSPTSHPTCSSPISSTTSHYKPTTVSPSMLTTSSSSSSPSCHPPADSSTTTGTPVFTARPFIISQPTGRPGHESSPRRAPPPVPDSPPFDPYKDSPLARTPASSSSLLPASSSSFMSPSSSSSSSSSPYRPWQSPEVSMHNATPAKPTHTNLPMSSQTHISNFSDNNILTNSNNVNVLKTSNLPSTKDDGLPPSLPPPRDYHHQRRESEPVPPNSFSRESPNDLHQPSMSRPRSEGNGIGSVNKENNNNIKGDNSGPASCHSRQPSQEELECDLKAKQLAQELTDKDLKLSEVLSLDTKKRMRYMDGLFSAHNGEASLLSPASPHTQDGTMDKPVATSPPSRDVTGSGGGGSPGSYKPSDTVQDDGQRRALPKEYWLSAPKAQVEMALRHSQEAGTDLVPGITDGQSLVHQKEELLKKLRKKLDVLEMDKVQLVQEIEENNALGVQVASMLASQLPASVVEKSKAYVDDQDKIVRLLLNLSGQLARAENAVESIPFNADSNLKKITADKRERLHDKHEEAKILKADIDKRKEQVSSLVQEGLDGGQWQRYSLYINKKPQLTIELQELDDKIKLGVEQMGELKKSIPNSNSHSS